MGQFSNGMRRFVALAAFAASAALGAASGQAATVNASIGTYASVGDGTLSMAWSWDQATGAVDSVSLTAVGEPGRRLENGYSANNLSVTSTAFQISSTGNGSTQQFFAVWTITVTGSPTLSYPDFGGQTEVALTEIGIVANIGDQAARDALVLYDPASADPRIASGGAAEGITLSFEGLTSTGNPESFGVTYTGTNYTASVSAVPVPAGLPLALAGLGTLVALRRKQRTV